MRKVYQTRYGNCFQACVIYRTTELSDTVDIIFPEEPEW